MPTEHKASENNYSNVNDEVVPTNLITLLNYSKRVLVVGDIILDKFVYGICNRIAPDIPVPIFTETNEELRLGGAGNVVNNLLKMCLAVDFVTLVGVGDDEVAHLLREKGTDVEGLVTVQNYRVKTITRFVADNHHLLRVNKNVDYQIEESTKQKILEHVRQRMDSLQYDVVLLSDYRTGVLSYAVTQGIISYAKSKGIPTVVDPKSAEYDRFNGATYIKPNKEDARNFLGEDIFTQMNPLDICRAFCDKLNISICILTLDRDGIALYRHDKNKSFTHFQVFPPEENVKVIDVCGAGDTVLASIAFGVCHKWQIDRICNFANQCAANVIQQRGTVPVNIFYVITDQVIYTNEDLVNLKRIIPIGTTVVLTSGCFDLLHVGHIEFLRNAKHQGDFLVVAMNSDISVKKNKGHSRPIVPLAHRAKMLLSTKFVDFVVVFDEQAPYWIVETLEPDVFVKGPGKSEKELRQIFPSLKKVVIVPGSNGISSSMFQSIKGLTIE